MIGLVSAKLAKFSVTPSRNIIFSARSFHRSATTFGLEEFFDPKVDAGQVLATGRGWTVPELRRKSFDDLHKLYYVLYKERNLLLTNKERARKFQSAPAQKEEMRYTYVKRAMAGIKMVIAERKEVGLLEEDIAMRNEKAQAQGKK